MCNIDKNNQRIKKPDVGRRLSYLLAKGSFPYDWAKSVDDYSLTYLVPKSVFFNSMTETHITDEKYQLAKEVWNVFQMKNMLDYMETNCMSDTLLLAEVFETFINDSISHVGIDSTHFTSFRIFAYKVFLK